MRRERVDSSTLTSVGYSKKTSMLELEFSSGKVYQYFAVPAVVHQGLMRAESKGAFFNDEIKDAYPFSRL